MNYGKKHDLPFGIMDVAGLLRLNIRRRAPGQVYVDCPICGDRRGKMNLNTAKDLWRCNYCGEGGGMLSLYAKVYGVSNSDAYREICDALAVNGFSPDYTVPEKTAPTEAEQSDAASVQEVHQTLSFRRTASTSGLCGGCPMMRSHALASRVRRPLSCAAP